ncbi:three-Cys-motif partner protein [Sedimentibacter acidaminivorans]|uniref:Three-Cys-motif partner protein n=1 Tax=Sedimentibacter acidaminivorans TaxID=913099 RepID=A0ABS4GH23_9FIRM|nr:three-Cys-motif partner protein TcmP [Sedimentibacter acidaminivorans]MBP1926685.1 three-Cys-motif partner protein [Sedimentibacter acidaminivorans]
MASNNNVKIISDAHPHTIKKFELIETYIKSWAHKLMLTESCTGIVFIDCMCNSGIYKDDDGKNVYGTPIRVADALLDVARTYPDKQVHLYFNDYDKKKIEELEKHLPQEERNYKIITTTRDGNELLKWIGPQLNQNSHMHFFLLYDPYDASIDWDALLPFFRNWGEVLINHMISDSVRAISQVKREDKKKKYEGTYRVNSISELVPYGSNQAAYEKRVLEIIEHMKGSAGREYYVSAFPFFNTKNALVYDLVHCTSHEKGFKLFKSTAWKTFGDKSSSKNKQGNNGQLSLDFLTGETVSVISVDEYCYDVFNMAAYVQNNFKGQNDVSLEKIWELLDDHPVFPSEGYKKELKSILKKDYDAKVSTKSITFADRRG